LQFPEGLSDRNAANACRGRIDSIGNTCCGWARVSENTEWN
jgi:hypothetical protein